MAIPGLLGTGEETRCPGPFIMGAADLSRSSSLSLRCSPAIETWLSLEIQTNTAAMTRTLPSAQPFRVCCVPYIPRLPFSHPETGTLNCQSSGPRRLLRCLSYSYQARQRDRASKGFTTKTCNMKPKQNDPRNRMRGTIGSSLLDYLNSPSSPISLTTRQASRYYLLTVFTAPKRPRAEYDLSRWIIFAVTIAWGMQTSLIAE
jgi:hypothetical protein